MRSRSVGNMSGATLAGLALGVVAGLAAGLLAAPMRGRDLRTNLRSRVSGGATRLQSLASSGNGWMRDTLNRSVAALEEGRRAFITTRAARTPEQLTAKLGEIASMHGGAPPANWETAS